MPTVAIISLCLTAGLLILSFIFRVAGKIRLTIPILCLLLFSTVLNKWAGEHETLAFIILFSLLGLTVLSWIVSLIKTIRRKRDEKHFEDDVEWKIRRAREMGVPLDKVQFNEQGDLLDPRTGEPVVYGDGVQYEDTGFHFRYLFIILPFHAPHHLSLSPLPGIPARSFRLQVCRLSAIKRLDKIDMVHGIDGIVVKLPLPRALSR